MKPSLVIFSPETEAESAPPASIEGESALRAWIDSGGPFEIFEDLCLLAAAKDPRLAELASRESLRVASPYAPRATRALFAHSAAPLPPTAEILHVPEAELRKFVQATDADSAGPWRPWFPVIDPDRCTNCKKCLAFCLFGVYELDGDQSVVVANPRQCKNNCPACARVCPTEAIIFPKYPDAPINGAPGGSKDSGPTRVDLQKLMTPDVMDALRRRGGAFPG